MKGHVQAVSRGVWRIYIENGRDPLTGRRRRITSTFHGTKKAAEEEANRLVVSVREGKRSTAAATFGALLDAWLAHAEPNLAAWSIRNYRSKVEVHIRPALGDVKLSQLTTARLDEFYRELLKRGRKGSKKPLSAQTVRHVHAIIRRACVQGCKWGWLDRNPALLAEPPTVEQRHPDLPDIAAVLSIIELLNVDMRDIAWLAVVSGARRGELCGIQWGDVDLTPGAAHLTIARSIADTPAELITKGTKTGRTRNLALDDITVVMLVARRARQAEKALACGVPLADTGFVFADIPGAQIPLKPSSITKRWTTAAHNAGVKCRFHDLRHLSVTELLEAGFEVGAVAQRVGHASTKMTHDVYQHARRSHDAAAAEHLAGLLAPQ